MFCGKKKIIKNNLFYNKNTIQLKNVPYDKEDKKEYTI